MSDPSNENNTASAIGWLLLRDGHAVPLFGLEPHELKRSSRHTILMPEIDLRHRRRLTAIVDSLGFAGDFGTYEQVGWPRFIEFLGDHGCTTRRDLFADAARCVFFGSVRLGPNRRQLAERIQLGPKPSRVFLGTGVDWDAWDARAGATRQRAFRPWIDLKAVPSGREEAVQWLLERRGEFDGEWGFLDDKLVAGPKLPLVDKSYYDDAKRMAEMRDQDVQRLQNAVKLFRSVFDAQAEGWVEVLGFNDKLTVLRAHDGTWDILWNDLREAPPPPERVATTSYVLHVSDRPEVLLDEQDLARRLYFRRKVWDEREAHLAEQHFYDRGGDRAERRRTSDDEVRRLYLADTGAIPPVARPVWEGPPPAGFHVVRLGEVRRLVSDLVTVDEFRRMFAETSYLERRSDGDDDWDRANVGAAASDPAGATWNDAQALCAWKERALKVGVRLLTKDEHRALRPFFSHRYEQMAGGDFMWESWPPRPLEEQQTASGTHRVDVPSAVAWSEPRFLPIDPEHPEFPADSGIARSSRKRWLTDFPPRAPWVAALPWAEHSGLRYIDAWDAYEWCQEWGWISGRFWEGVIGVGSWGAYKNVKVGVRLILDVDLP